MNAVALPIPDHWRQVAPPRSTYRIGDVELDVSAIQASPEDPIEWIRVEIARRGATEPATATRVTTATGWPMLAAETTIGSTKLFVGMYQFLELAAVVTVVGEKAAYDASIDDVKLVLMQPKVHWGSPPVTLAALLASFAPPEER
jgi:hypothetical protein